MHAGIRGTQAGGKKKSPLHAGGPDAVKPGPLPDAGQHEFCGRPRLIAGMPSAKCQVPSAKCQVPGAGCRGPIGHPIMWTCAKVHRECFRASDASRPPVKPLARPAPPPNGFRRASDIPATIRFPSRNAPPFALETGRRSFSQQPNVSPGHRGVLGGAPDRRVEPVPCIFHETRLVFGPHQFQVQVEAGRKHPPPADHPEEPAFQFDPVEGPRKLAGEIDGKPPAIRTFRKNVPRTLRPVPGSRPRTVPGSRTRG